MLVIGIDWGRQSLSLGYATERDVAGTGQAGQIGERSPVASATREGRARWLGNQSLDLGERPLVDPLDWCDAQPGTVRFETALQDWIEVIGSVKDAAVEDRLFADFPEAIGVALPVQALSPVRDPATAALGRLGYLPTKLVTRTEALLSKLLLRPNDVLAQPRTWVVVAVATETVGDDLVLETAAYGAYFEPGLGLALPLGRAGAQALSVPEEQLADLLDGVLKPYEQLPTYLVCGGDRLSHVVDWCSRRGRHPDYLDLDARNVAAGAAAAAWTALTESPARIVDDWAEIQYRLPASGEGEWARLGRPLPLGLAGGWRVREVLEFRQVVGLRVATALNRSFVLDDGYGEPTPELSLPSDPPLERLAVAAEIGLDGDLSLSLDADYAGGQGIQYTAKGRLEGEGGRETRRHEDRAKGAGIVLDAMALHVAAAEEGGRVVCEGEGLALSVAVPLSEGTAMFGEAGARRAAESPEEWYYLPELLPRLAGADSTVVLRIPVTRADLTTHLAQHIREVAGDRAPVCVSGSPGLPQGFLQQLLGARRTALIPLPAAMAFGALNSTDADGLRLREALLTPGTRAGLLHWGVGEARVWVGTISGQLNARHLAEEGLFTTGSAQEWPVPVSQAELVASLLAEEGEEWREALEEAVGRALDEGDSATAARLVGAANRRALEAESAVKELFSAPSEQAAERQDALDRIIAALAALPRDTRAEGVRLWIVGGPMLRFAGAADLAERALGGQGAEVFVRPAEEAAAGAARMAEWTAG